MINDNESNHSYRWNDDNYDYFDPFENLHSSITLRRYLVAIGCTVVILFGCISNILALVVLIRSRMWLQHEGYVLLAASFVTNIAILIFNTSSLCMSYVNWKYYPPHISNFMCKVWHFFMSVFFASGWLSVALLFNVYLREQRIHRRRCGCPIFAAKYCTLYASKIIVGVIFGVILVLGVPYLAGFERLPTRRTCSPNSVAVIIALLIELCLMWVLPFIFFLPIILILTLCISRDGTQQGFSQIEERSLADDQFRVAAVTFASMTLFSQFGVITVQYIFSGVRGLFSIGIFIQLFYGLSLGAQPILCFIIMNNFRKRFWSMLRGSRCCVRLLPDRLLSETEADNEILHMDSIREDERRPVET